MTSVCWVTILSVSVLRETALKKVISKSFHFSVDKQTFVGKYFILFYLKTTYIVTDSAV